MPIIFLKQAVESVLILVTGWDVSYVMGVVIVI